MKTHEDAAQEHDKAHAQRLATQQHELQQALDAQRAIESVVAANQQALELAKQEAHELQAQLQRLQQTTADMHQECERFNTQHASMRAMLRETQEQRRQAAAKALREDAAALEQSNARLEAARRRHAQLNAETQRLAVEIDAAKHEVAVLAL